MPINYVPASSSVLPPRCATKNPMSGSKDRISREKQEGKRVAHPSVRLPFYPLLEAQSEFNCLLFLRSILKMV